MNNAINLGQVDGNTTNDEGLKIHEKETHVSPFDTVPRHNEIYELLLDLGSSLPYTGRGRDFVDPKFVDVLRSTDGQNDG